MNLVRLACVKHTASIRPEPGSNSPVRFFQKFSVSLKLLRLKKKTFVLFEVFSKRYCDCFIFLNIPKFLI